jgi:ferredoxin--NADP+ reductase
VSVKVAVVGSGPSGMYAADALIERGACVDVFDRLPVPFGLVRYGVAPDHFSIRSVRDTLDQIWDKDGVRFVGNVEVGVDVSIGELQDAYDAIILTYGASSDRRLGIEGEDLSGSVAATDFVNWYTGHPDYHGPDFDSILPRVRSVAVIGVGNVAVDVVRVLSKTAEELARTDMPDHVLATLASAPVSSVHLLGRRGPAQASFTTKELKELGELAAFEVYVEPDDLELDTVSQAAIDTNKVAARNMKVLHEWAEREPRTDLPGRIDLHFFTRPTRISGDGQVAEVTVERTAFNADGQLIDTGRHSTIPVDLVVRSVGYRGRPLGSVPFDEDRGVIPNTDGRVLDGDEPIPGLYVAGWIKRGPTGIIGTNKKCAVGTVGALYEDIDSGDLVPADRSADDDLVDALVDRGVSVVSTAGWRAVDAAERSRGDERGKDRLTVHERADLLRIAST